MGHINDCDTQLPPETKIYPSLEIIISQSFKGNKKYIFEYMHPSAQAAAGSTTVCVHADPSAKIEAGTD